MTRDPAGNGWHIDRRIPLVLVITLMIQTGGIVWWASNLSSRVSVLEDKAQVRSSQADRITTLEVEVRVVRRSLDDISSKLDRIIERQN